MVGIGDATVKTKLIQPLHSGGYGLVGKTSIKRVINYGCQQYSEECKWEA